MSDKVLELGTYEDFISEEHDENDRHRQLVRRKLEEKLEEKRLRDEIFDDFYQY